MPAGEEVESKQLTILLQIVCYDVSKSPIRLVQRMGRTGRKRAGRIIVLVTEVRPIDMALMSFSSLFEFGVHLPLMHKRQ